MVPSAPPASTYLEWTVRTSAFHQHVKLPPDTRTGSHHLSSFGACQVEPRLFFAAKFSLPRYPRKNLGLFAVGLSGRPHSPADAPWVELCPGLQQSWFAPYQFPAFSLCKVYLGKSLNKGVSSTSLSPSSSLGMEKPTGELLLYLAPPSTSLDLV